MGAKSSKIEFAREETFPSCLKTRLSVSSAGTVTVVDHDVRVHNGKVWFKTKQQGL